MITFATSCSMPRLWEFHWTLETASGVLKYQTPRPAGTYTLFGTVGSNCISATAIHGFAFDAHASHGMSAATIGEGLIGGELPHVAPPSFDTRSAPPLS